MKMFKWQMNISIFKQLKGALTQHCQAWLQRMPPMQQEATLCTSGFLLKASVKTSGNKKWAVLGSATSRDHLKQCILSNAILARLFRQKLHTCGSHGHMMKLGCIWFQSADENNAKCMDKNYILEKHCMFQQMLDAVLLLQVLPISGARGSGNQSGMQCINEIQTFLGNSETFKLPKCLSYSSHWRSRSFSTPFASHKLFVRPSSLVNVHSSRINSQEIKGTLHW